MRTNDENPNSTIKYSYKLTSAIIKIIFESLRLLVTFLIG